MRIDFYFLPRACQKMWWRGRWREKQFSSRTKASPTTKRSENLLSKLLCSCFIYYFHPPKKNRMSPFFSWKKIIIISRKSINGIFPFSKPRRGTISTDAITQTSSVSCQKFISSQHMMTELWVTLWTPNANCLIQAIGVRRKLCS